MHREHMSMCMRSMIPKQQNKIHRTGCRSGLTSTGSACSPIRATAADVIAGWKGGATRLFREGDPIGDFVNARRCLNVSFVPSVRCVVVDAARTRTVAICFVLAGNPLSVVRIKVVAPDPDALVPKVALQVRCVLIKYLITVQPSRSPHVQCRREPTGSREFIFAKPPARNGVKLGT